MNRNNEEWVPPTEEQWLQWRIDFAKHLRGVRLQFRKWVGRSVQTDHDHCAACWKKFGNFDAPDIQHHGYATCEDYKFGALYDWVCQQCFDDLKDIMGWKVALSDHENSDSSHTPSSRAGLFSSGTRE